MVVDWEIRPKINNQHIVYILVIIADVVAIVVYSRSSQDGSVHLRRQNVDRLSAKMLGSWLVLTIDTYDTSNDNDDGSRY